MSKDSESSEHHEQSQATPADDLDLAWSEKASIIRSFLERRPQYEQLGNEIAYILTKRLDERQIKYAMVTSRAKALRSFIEKLSRKEYSDPLTEITDMAGVRVVFLYKGDRPQIERVIETEFEVFEKVDKVEQQAEDQFGYGALHYLVHLGQKSSGARYDDLKGLVCELQVRTVLQDAWAIIDHHLMYKNKAAVPKPLRRKVNSLAGLFESADDHLDAIRQERESYRDLVIGRLSDASAGPLDQALDLDTLEEFVRWRFPGLETTSGRVLSTWVFNDLTTHGYKTLRDLNSALDRTDAARAELNKLLRPSRYGLNEVARAIALLHPAGRGHWDEEDREVFRQVEDMLRE